MHRIHLYITAGQWMTWTDDPQVQELFGTMCLPTPFMSSVPQERVAAEIRRLNPDRLVIVGRPD